jgi:hypothetical protein
MATIFLLSLPLTDLDLIMLRIYQLECRAHLDLGVTHVRVNIRSIQTTITAVFLFATPSIHPTGDFTLVRLV